MEVHQLRYFIALAEEGNFSRAAERVRVAQPSLSQQIQKLEGEVGQPLFDRLKRKVTLTEAGVGLLPFARRVINELADAQRFINDSRDEPSGVVRVGMIATIAPYIAGKLAAACAARFPKIELAIIEDVTENLVRANDDGEIDVAIISTCKPTAKMQVHECMREPLVLALPSKHPLANQRQVNARQLKNETILMLEESHCLSHQIRRWCRARNLKPKEDTTVIQISTLLSLVAAGQGICIVPQMAIGNELAKGCAFVSISGNAPKREINFLRNNSRYQTRAVSAFCGLADEIICAATS